MKTLLNVIFWKFPFIKIFATFGIEVWILAWIKVWVKLIIDCSNIGQPADFWVQYAKKYLEKK